MSKPIRQRVVGHIDHILHAATTPFRWATAAWRPLPACLLIGTQKGGTSSLHHILSLHPDIAASRPKEVHYFDYHHRRGAYWYRAAFPMARPGCLGLESSPLYLLHPHVPTRVRACLPGVKLVVMLRDPVKRAYSNWQHTRRHGDEPLSFEEAVDRESERTDKAWQRLLANPDAGRSPAFVHSYLRRSQYAEQLARWYACFPRESILLLKSEDFFADPGAVVHQVLAWLGANERIPDDLSARNTGGGYPPLDPELTARLRRHFEPHNQELLRLTGRDFAW